MTCVMFDRNRMAERYEASKPNREPGLLQVSNNLSLDFEEIFCDGKKLSVTESVITFLN